MPCAAASGSASHETAAPRTSDAVTTRAQWLSVRRCMTFLSVPRSGLRRTLQIAQRDRACVLRRLEVERVGGERRGEVPAVGDGVLRTLGEGRRRDLELARQGMLALVDPDLPVDLRLSERVVV